MFKVLNIYIMFFKYKTKTRNKKFFLIENIKELKFIYNFDDFLMFCQKETKLTEN